MFLQADHITVYRLNRPVLRDVSLAVEAGDCISVIGPNGAGKSTLLETLLGLLPVQSGRIKLGDRDLRHWSRRELAQRMAYVQQVHEGHFAFTVREVIEAGRFAYLNPLDPLSVEDQRIVTESACLGGVGDLLDRRLDTLSGGERQKAFLASALAQQTPALLLDEPASALDPARQIELVSTLRQLHRAGKALMVVCHDLNLPLALGGRVLAIKEGAVAFDEPVDALLDTDRLRRLFGASFDVHQGAASRVSVALRFDAEEGPK